MERIDEAELLRRVISSALLDVHTAQPGEVESYDRTNQLADVKPTVRPGGEELPVLPSCPVIWPRGGDGYLVMPLEAGDTGLIISCEVDLGAWRERGQAGDPGDDGRHELAFSVFLPGLVAKGKELAAPSGATILAGDDTRIGTATADEKIIGGDSFETAHDTLMSALNIWCQAVSTAITGLGGDITVETGTFLTAIVSFNSNLEGALSSKVRVKL